MTAPEQLLLKWLGDEFGGLASETIARPLIVPYDQLADIDGWVIPLDGRPKTPSGRALPERIESIGGAAARIATAMLIAADYATRRGALDVAAVKSLLARESPLAIVLSNALDEAIPSLLQRAETAGIPVVRGFAGDPNVLRSSVDSFSMRARAHKVVTNCCRHDPAFTFQTIVADRVIGGDARSSFVLHNHGEHDGVTVNGEPGESMAIEVGVSADEFSLESTLELELLAATIPSFFEGVASRFDGQAITIGAHGDLFPSGQEIGLVLRAWFKGLTDANLVDVRIAFDSPRGDAAAMIEMRMRATEFRRYRAGIIAGQTPERAAANRQPLIGQD